MAKLGDLQEWCECGYRDNLPPDRVPVDYPTAKPDQQLAYQGVELALPRAGQ